MAFARSRREFLVNSLATGLIVSFGATTARAALRHRFVRPQSLSWLDVHDMAALEGQRVTLHGEGGEAISARVIEVESRDRRHRGTTVEQFSVVLRTGLREALPQQTFLLENPEFGSVALFMVPVVSRSRAIHYEAVVSRIVA